MASVTITSFPAGTSVSAYPASNWLQSQLPPSGAPQGSSVETHTVGSDGTATFTALADGTRYYFAGQVSGSYRYVTVQVPPLSTTGTGTAVGVTVTPAGSISSTNVQAALEELDSDLTTNTAAIAANVALIAKVVAVQDQNVDGTWPARLTGYGEIKWRGLGANKGAWTASTVYAANDVVTNGGNVYSAKTGFTSGGSFSATNWNQIPMAAEDSLRLES